MVVLMSHGPACRRSRIHTQQYQRSSLCWDAAAAAPQTGLRPRRWWRAGLQWPPCAMPAVPSEACELCKRAWLPGAIAEVAASMAGVT